MDWLQRFKEPSSYAAISAILLLFGINVPMDLASHIANAGAAATGIAGFLMSEGKKDQ